mmetsp:Transcript_81126/g.204238  ORF Transcript_81126/g.204238 Transcript_81126/m.204238 type:complete len:244 (+) Transcript_81126:1864-2595(+)
MHHDRCLPQPGRPERQHDGAERTRPAGVHPRLHEGGRPPSQRGDLRRAPRHRHRAGGSHRGRLPEGRDAGSILRAPHAVQREDPPRAPGGVRRNGWRHQVHADVQRVHRISELPSLLLEPSLGHHRVSDGDRDRDERLWGELRPLRRVVLRLRGRERAGGRLRYGRQGAARDRSNELGKVGLYHCDLPYRRRAYALLGWQGRASRVLGEVPPWAVPRRCNPGRVRVVRLQQRPLQREVLDPPA